MEINEEKLPYYFKDANGQCWYFRRDYKGIVRKNKAQEYICDNCGEPFLRLPQLVNFNKKRSERKETYCSRKCSNEITAEKHRTSRLGEKNANWKGGKTINPQGYVVINNAKNHTINPKKQAKEHRIVMEKKLNRPLFKNEMIHHKNGNRQDNRIENLEIWIKGHPWGQRVEDVIPWCIKILKRYKPEILKEGV